MMSCARANAARVKYLQLGHLQHVNKPCTIYDTGMGGGSNKFIIYMLFHGLLSLDIYQQTVPCFVIMLTLYYVLICRVLKLTYTLILLVRVHSPAGKQPGETIYQGSDQ